MLRFVSAILVLAACTATPVLAGTCFGLENCNACKSCRYCRNCNSGGQLCGVWHATHGQQGAAAATATPAVIPSYAVNAMPPIAPPANLRPSASLAKIRNRPAVAKEDPFVTNVRRRIAASWGSFPTSDLTARIYFEIDQSGNLVNLKVLSASGDPEGIGQAVTAIKSAAPFGTPSQTERFAINFKDGQMDYTPEVQRFQTTSVQMLPPNKADSIVPSKIIENQK